MSEKPLHVRVAEALGWTSFPYILVNAPWWDQPCVPPGEDPHISTVKALPRYDTDWSATGPLIEKYGIDVEFDSDEEWTKKHPDRRWDAIQARTSVHQPERSNCIGFGDTPLIAVCNLILALKEAGKLE